MTSPESSIVTVEDLRDIDWNGVSRTYGNNHSTLIGFVVSWWLNKGQENEVLDGGLSIPTTAMGGRRGHCDAILLKDGLPRGVVEVEGTRYLPTVSKMIDFLNHFQSIQFGVFLAYRTKPASSVHDEFDFWLNEQRPIPTGKVIYYIGIEKEWGRHNGVRGTSPYYQGTPSRVWLNILFGDTHEVQGQLWPYP